MSSVIASLRSLAPVVARSLPCAPDLAGLSSAEAVEAARLLGGIRAQLDESLALVASDIHRQSTRELGTAGLAVRNGFKDAAGLVQELAGVRREDAARLIRIGGMLETAQAVAPAPVDSGSDEPGSEPPAPPARSLDVLAALPGPWDAPIAVALKCGWLSATHADAVRTGLGTPRTSALRDAWRQAVLELIGDCWASHWSPEDVTRAAKHHRASLDGALAAAEAERRYELRSFKRILRASGMAHYDIDLDPESDARFYGPIKRLLSPRFGGPRFTTKDEIAAARELEHDPRTNEQLQVDTLVELVDRAVSTDKGDLFKTHEPQVMIAVTTADLAKARDTQEVLHRHLAGDHTSCPTSTDVVDNTVSAGSLAVDASAEPGVEPGTAAKFGTDRAGHTGAAFGIKPGGCPGPDRGIAWIDGKDEPLTAADALRIMCDRGYSPLLFDETGQTIDLGKDQRYFTRQQRRAIAKRDGRCLYPGCDRPPEDCEYHHINPWALSPGNRKSEVRDGVLLCRRHHKMIHDLAAHIERRGNQYWLHWPGKTPVRLHTKSAVQTELHTRRTRTRSDEATLATRSVTSRRDERPD